MKKIQKVLSRVLGLDPETLGRDTLERVVASRMRSAGASDHVAYAALLERSAGEVRALTEAVVVSETWFFREPKAFDCLKEFAIRRRGSGKPLRALSVPCATGEEPYSIAMTLLDLGFDPSGFVVEGVDVSERALETARRGVYGRNSFRGGQDAPRAHFAARPLGQEVRPEVRRCVRFGHGNLLAPGFQAGMEFDVVFCRNLLIYFDTAARKAAFATLRRLLSPGGLLFAGHAEASEFMAAGFTRHGPAGSFAFQQTTDGKTSTHLKDEAPAVTREKLGSPRLEGPLPRTRRQHSAGFGVSPVVASAARTVTATVPTQDEPTPAHGGLHDVQRLADCGEVKAARVLCEQVLSRDLANTGAHTLLGVLNSAAGDVAAAQASLERALYLDPNHHEALVHLALIHATAGRTEVAERLRRRAARCAKTGGDP